MNPTTCNEPTTPAAYGFTMVAGNLTVKLGHRAVPGGVLLFATTQIADQTPQMWRQFVVPREAVNSMAHQLVSEAEDYLLATQGLVRQAEDLDFDDFIAHATMSANGELN